MPKNNTSIAVAYGDGIGPEIMDATLLVLQKAQARIDIETIEIGEKLYTKGISTGISEQAWDIVRRNKILLKAPITTPQGKGHKSLNVTFRKALGLYVNLRPAISYYPVITSLHKKMNLVVVRENEEDLYCGVEYRSSKDSTVALKLITGQGSERIIRYAFEYARVHNRKKVTAFVKDNIMKISDGMFHNIFKEIAKEYPSIEAGSMIIDIAAARIASRPEDFDVVVTLNLYGDIVSDIAADVSGSVGLAGSANIGKEFAMFEAIHGSAPDIAGKKIANPSGLLNGAVMMLEYIGQGDVASKIQNGWLTTLEQGIHTADIYNASTSKEKVSTMEFAHAVVENLGMKPSTLPSVSQRSTEKIKHQEPKTSNDMQKLIGVDVYIDLQGFEAAELIDNLKDICEPKLKLHVVSQKGFKIWPCDDAKISADLLQCRFIGYEDTGLTGCDITEGLHKITESGYNISYTYNLFMYGTDVLGFTNLKESNMKFFMYLYTSINGIFIGNDEFDNRYYESKKPIVESNKKKRWVIYNGLPEPSKIPPQWFLWLHYQDDKHPTAYPKKLAWEKPHLPNLTGTKNSYVPPSNPTSCNYEKKDYKFYEQWSSGE